MAVVNGSVIVRAFGVEALRACEEKTLRGSRKLGPG